MPGNSEIDSVVFVFKVNNHTVAEKTRIQVDQFCTAYCQDCPNPLTQDMKTLFASFNKQLENSNNQIELRNSTNAADKSLLDSEINQN